MKYTGKTMKSFYKKNIFLITALLIFACENITSQVTQQWSARFNSSGNSLDYPASIKTDAAGNVYVAGNTAIGGNYDYIILKYNSTGTQQWAVSYNGPGNKNDILNSMVIDYAGNLFVTGKSFTDSLTFDDCVTIKYNTNGILQWIARYDQNHLSEEGSEITIDNSGNVYITGATQTSSINHDFLTLKYNPSGVQQWVSVRNGSANGYDYSSELAIDNLGNIYVCGQSQNGPGLHQKNFLTVKYNTAGAEQWSVMYNGPSDSADIPTGIGVDSLNNVYVSGNSRGSGTNLDITVLKYNTGGIQQWVSRYNGSGNGSDNCVSIVVNPSGTVYVTGSIYSSSSDMVAIKYNSLGTQQWVNIFNGAINGFDGGYDMKLDKAGNVYVTGYTEVSTIDVDYYTTKYSSSGATLWIKTFDGGISSDDVAYQISVDTLNNVYVTGISKGTGTGDDIVTIKYSQVVGVIQNSNEIPSDYMLHQNSPNPFNPSTNIKFSIPGNTDVKLTVYDMLGKEIRILVNEFTEAGNYAVKFNASTLSSGIYFYKLNAGEFTEIKKMVLIK